MEQVLGRDLASALTLSSFLIASIVFAASLLLKHEDVRFFQVGGVFLVASLAFAARHIGVYLLAIFIVATLITRLDFLENLAALLWRRDRFWEYRIALTKASKVEKEQKLASEVQVYQQLQPQQSRADAIRDIRMKEMQVLDAFRALLTIRIPQAHFETDVALRSMRGTVRVVDAVVATPAEDFLIEVKAHSARRFFPHALYELRATLTLYNAAIPKKQARGILIVPDNWPNITEFAEEDVAVLKYDEGSKNFTNADAVFAWMLGGSVGRMVNS